MSEVAVAGLHVDEVEARPLGQDGGRDEVVHQAIELVVGEHRGVVGTDPFVEQRMAVRRPRRRPRAVRTGVPPGVGELEPGHLVGRASSERSSASPSTVVSSITSWLGLARPSRTTAVASPQTRPAPLWPSRCHRRRTRSVGAPSAVPSHPSMGSVANRLADLDGPRTAVPKRRACGEHRRIDHIGDGQIDAALGQVRAQLLQRLQLLDLRESARHSRSSSRSAMSCSTARSASGRRGAPTGVASVDAQPRSCRNSAAS